VAYVVSLTIRVGCYCWVTCEEQECGICGEFNHKSWMFLLGHMGDRAVFGYTVEWHKLFL